MLDDSDSEGDSNVQLTVNEHFAQAYAYRKEREELARLKEKYGSDEEEDEEDSESESEDEDGQELTPAVDVAILRILSKIKSKDPEIYNSQNSIFEQEEKRTSATMTKRNTKDKSKPLTVRQQTLNGILRPRSPSPTLPSHVEEQKTLRSETISAFHHAVKSADGDEDDDTGLFLLREKTTDELERDEEEYREFLQREVGGDITSLVTIDDVPQVEVELGAGDESRELSTKKKKKGQGKKKEETDQEFLMNYILNRGWIDRESRRVPTYSEVTRDAAAQEKARDEDASPTNPNALDDDDEFDDVVDHFESSYNFRFEEPNAAVIATHPRTIPTLVRRPDTGRKDAREARKQKKAEEMAKKREEVQRLKALKMREIRQKLDKVSKEGGKAMDAKGLGDLDLEGDWDPDAHDQQMAGIYDDEEFYAEYEEEGKPQWADDIDISDLVGDSEEPKKKKKKKKKEKDGNEKEAGVDVDAMDAEGKWDEEEWDGMEEMRKRKLNEYMNEIYALEFNDMIGDMPTRFSYTSVPSQNFALTPAEILLATDSELNEYMGVGKYAPYRKDGGWDAGRAQRLKAFKEKLKNRSWGQGVEEEGAEEEAFQLKAKKRKGKKERQRAKEQGPDKAIEVSQQPSSSGPEGAPPKKRRRKQNEIG